MCTVLFACQSMMLPSISAEESIEENAGSSVVLGEAEGLRGQFEKHFANGDGTMTAIVYPTAVHYEKDGEWVDYDNTLVSTARDGQVVYQNSSNPLQVQFAQEGEQEDLVHLEYDGHEISWSLATADVDTQQPVALMSSNALQPEMLETMSTTAEQSEEVDAEQRILASAQAFWSGEEPMPLENQTGVAISAIDDAVEAEVIQASDTQVETMDLYEQAQKLPRLASTVEYEESFPEIDVQYTVDSETVKEDFILNAKPTMDSIVIRLQTNGLNAFLNDDKTVSLYPSDSETAAFHMSAPYMYDTAGAVCHDIDVSLAKVEEGYLISYPPDREWLEDKSRVYPVIIDPSVSVSQDTSNIDDTYVHPGDYAGQHYGETSFKVGTYQGTLNRAFLRFLNYPEFLGSGSTINTAILHLYMVNGTTTSNPVSIQEVFSPWEPGSITWNSHLNMSMDYIGHADPDGVSEYKFWITNLVKRALNDENTGFMLQYLYEEYNDWNQLYSGNYSASGKRPWLEIDYTAPEYIHFYTGAKLTGGVRGRKYYLGEFVQDFANDVETALSGWESDGTVSFSRTSVPGQSVMDIYMFYNDDEYARANAWVEYYNTSKKEVPKDTSNNVNHKNDPLYDWYYAKLILNQKYMVAGTSKAKTTIAHEMGHVFGLDENIYYLSDYSTRDYVANKQSIMCQEGYGRLVDSAQACDRRGVRALYGY
ncbi:DNRLRE domain-containing protein [Solibaculum mannosilyticum]|uniref:DNRLRE domain-containing protein n=1 Tax=Solibaculum mannosilyticum TaxID=2780922 RepID=UPI000B7EAAC1